MKKKVYIQYARPFENENDEPPIVEIWSAGEKPDKKLANQETVYVYDVDKEDGVSLNNQRIWNGVE